MDPTTTFEIVIDTEQPNSERRRAAHDLLAWLDLGGFPPSGSCADNVRARCILTLEATQ
jgi:hypothetical protein